MPRDGSGTYTLPSGNPVVDGTIIDTGWANPTMADFAVQFNNVLTRDGVLGPNLPFKFISGTAGAPGATFNADATTGLFRGGAGQMNVSVSGAQVGYWDATGYHGAISGSVTGGVYAAAADTVAAPGFTWVGDLNTGMWHPADEIIAWTNTGVETMRLTSTGLGLGVTVPASRLDVLATAGALAIAIRGRASDSIGTFEFFNNAGSTRQGYIQGKANTLELSADGASGTMTFLTNAAERMRINATGQVGIGKTPALARVDIAGINNNTAFGGNGDLRITSLNGAVGTYYGWNQLSSDGDYLFGITGVEKMRLVGSSATTATLMLNTTGSIWSTAGRTVLEMSGPSTVLIGLKVNNTSGSYIYTDGTDSYFNSNYTGSLKLGHGGVAGMQINSSGIISEAATGYEIGYKNIPRQTGSMVNATAFATSAGFTVNTGFPAGWVAAIYNDSAAAITITQGGGLTLRLAGTTTTGNRTIAARGWANIWFNSTSEALLMGPGVS